MAAPLNVDWSDVAARASTLVERLDGLVELRRTVPELEARRLHRWCELVARGDPDRFDARLALDGLDAERAALLVGDASWRDGTPLPEWTSLVAEALGREPFADDRCLPPAGSAVVPFQEALVPFVRAAAGRLGDRSEVCADTALALLERSLLRMLSAAASMVLERECRAWRRARITPFEEALLRAERHPGRQLYDAWLHELRGGELLRILDRYPVLARSLGLVALGWTRATAEFLDRLVADRRRLAEAFADGRPIGRLVGANDRPVSDPHLGRRQVVVCAFESGLRLVYKPRSLRGEIAYGELLERFSDRTPGLDLKRLLVLDCGDHGWVEHVACADVPDRAAAARFYRRAGALLALLHAVGGTDCHCENVVACADQPVVVDSETVLCPSFAVTGADDEHGRALDGVLGDSVLAVGLLPYWFSGPSGAVDVGALGDGARVGLDEPPVWEHPNTDVARLVRRPVAAESSPSSVVLKGSRQRAADYEEDVVAGFRAGYAWLLAHGAELLTPLERLHDAPLRIVLRPTRSYALARLRSGEPGSLRAGVDHGIELEALARPILDLPEPGGLWPVHRLEQRQLDAGDIPSFEAPGAAAALMVDGIRIPLFRDSALGRAAARLASLSTDDEQWQLALVRAAVATTRPTTTRRKANRRGGAGTGGWLEAAVRIAEDLDAAAVRTERHATWLGMRLRDEAVHWTLDVTRDGLYDGTTGVAVFLAALARATGEARWRDLASAALERTLSEAERHPRRLATSDGLGGASGAGGIVFGLALCGRFLGDERPVEAARAVARSLSPDDVRRDDRLDLLGGSAGVLAGLLALPGPPGELAASTARRLAGKAVDGRTGPGWPTIGGRALDGFSHGTAGIALVLARYALASGDESLLRLACDAIRGESERFDTALGGWRDRRRDEPALGPGWCHGAAGIALSRLELLRLAPGGELEEIARRDLERALPAVTADGGLDHLCCGAAGEADVLLEAARVTGEARPLERARRFCDDVAGRVLAGDGPGLAAPATGAAAIPVPGLYQGTAGVGLVLLRAAHPELPCALSWAVG